MGLHFSCVRLITIQASFAALQSPVCLFDEGRGSLRVVSYLVLYHEVK